MYVCKSTKRYDTENCTIVCGDFYEKSSGDQCVKKDYAYASIKGRATLRKTILGICQHFRAESCLGKNSQFRLKNSDVEGGLEKLSTNCEWALRCLFSKSILKRMPAAKIYRTMHIYDMPCLSFQRLMMLPQLKWSSFRPQYTSDAPSTMAAKLQYLGQAVVKVRAAKI